MKRRVAAGETLQGNDKYEGFCADLATLLAEIVGFSFEIRLVRDGKFGANEDGNWNGIVGELMRKVCPEIVSLSRKSISKSILKVLVKVY